MEAYNYEEDIEEVVFDDERRSHRRMIFEDKDGGRYYSKYLLHDNMWYVYISDKRSLINGGYYVQVPGSDGLKVILEVVDNHVVEEINENDDIGLLGLYFFDEYK